METFVLYDRSPYGFIIEGSAPEDPIVLRTPNIIGPAITLKGRRETMELSSCLLHFLSNGVTHGVDDGGVTLLAEAMRKRLAEKRAQGRSGWNDPVLCPPERLARMLIDSLIKGDPVTVANFSMMLYNRDDAVGVLGNVFQAWVDDLVTPPSDLQNQLAVALDNAKYANEKLDAEKKSNANLVSAWDEERKNLVALVEAERSKVKVITNDLNESKKEVTNSQVRRETAERQLARAQGYIDRITEGEPPTHSVVESGFERVGEVSQGYHRSNRRGPNLMAESSNAVVVDYPYR